MTQGAVPHREDSWVLAFRPTGRGSGKPPLCPHISDILVRKAEWPLKWSGRDPALLVGRQPPGWQASGSSRWVHFKTGASSRAWKDFHLSQACVRKQTLQVASLLCELSKRLSLFLPAQRT